MFPVRDTFIDVNEENISPAEIKNFKKHPCGDAEVHQNGSVDHRGTPHDVGHTGGEKNFSYSITIIKPAFKLRNAKTQIILQFCLGLNKKMLSYRKASFKDALSPPPPLTSLEASLVRCFLFYKTSGGNVFKNIVQNIASLSKKCDVLGFRKSTQKQW